MKYKCNIYVDHSALEIREIVCSKYEIKSWKSVRFVMNMPHLSVPAVKKCIIVMLIIRRKIGNGIKSIVDRSRSKDRMSLADI